MFFREGIKWQPGMTEERARIYAEDYDDRIVRRQLIERGKDGYGFLKGTVPGFFSGMLGNLPDPVNLIPFGAGANASKAGFFSAIRAGAVSGVLSNAAVDTLVLPSLKERGDDVGFAGFALDMAFGALLGGALGGAGYGLSALAARRNIHGSDRQIILDAFEDATLSVSRGEASDVGRVGGIREVLGEAYDRVKNDPLGGPPDEVLAVLRSPEFGRILVERGPAIFKQDGELLFSGEYIQRISGFPRSGGGMVKIIWKHGEKSKEAPHLQVTKEDVLRLPEILDEYMPIPHKGRKWEWSAMGDDGIPLTVIIGKQKKAESITVVSVFRNKNKNRTLSQKREAPASLGVSKSSIEDRMTGTKDTTPGDYSESPPGGRELSKGTPTSPDGQGSPEGNHFAGTGDTPAGPSSNWRQQGQGLSKNINPGRTQVNPFTPWVKCRNGKLCRTAFFSGSCCKARPSIFPCTKARASGPPAGQHCWVFRI